MVAIDVGFVMTVRRKEMIECLESMRSEMDLLLERVYEEGYKSCFEYYSKQPFNAARTDLLSEAVEYLQKNLKHAEKKLTLATRLLKYAQSTPCGQQGQFDRFFEEGYDAGYNDVPSEGLQDQGEMLQIHSDSI